jgi:hypothetical protein
MHWKLPASRNKKTEAQKYVQTNIFYFNTLLSGRKIYGYSNYDIIYAVEWCRYLTQTKNLFINT